jgi:phosphate transport system permease protein
MAIRADQVGSSGAFGAIPVFTGTLLISAIAMLVAVPIGLMSAIYLSEYANRVPGAPGQAPDGDPGRHPHRGLRLFRRPDRGPVHPRTRRSPWAWMSPPKAPWPPGLVMGIMIIPFVSSLSDDVINAVPQSLRDGAYGPGRHPSPRPSARWSAGGPARHRRRRAAGGLPGHRRNHDRGHGRRPGRQPDRQPAEASPR